MRRNRSLNLRYLFGLLFAVGLVGAGCGGDDGGTGDVPANGVAKVDDVVITKTAYEQMRPSTLVANPEPQQAEIATMQILLQREWTEQEAEAEGVEVSDAEVRKALAEQRAQFFKKKNDYVKYLRRSKRSEKDLYAGMRQKLLIDKLIAKAVREAPQIDDERVQRYYEKNRGEFKLPLRYQAHTVITRTEEQADKAVKAAEDGTSWKEVFATYSPKGAQVPDAWKARTLTKTGIKNVDAALAKSKAGDVFAEKTQYGWVVIGVVEALPAKQRTLEETKAEIRARLVGSRREDATNAYVQDFQDQYKEKSVCADAYKVAECSNGPDENPQPKPPEDQRPSPDNPGEGADK